MSSRSRHATRSTSATSTTISISSFACSDAFRLKAEATKSVGSCSFRLQAEMWSLVASAFRRKIFMKFAEAIPAEDTVRRGNTGNSNHHESLGTAGAVSDCLLLRRLSGPGQCQLRRPDDE